MLEQFLGASFHQDWMSDSADSESAIRQYLAGESPRVVNTILQELDHLLSLRLSEEKLRDVALRDLGCYYEPNYKGQSMTEWLHFVRSLLAVASRQAGKDSD